MGVRAESVYLATCKAWRLTSSAGQRTRIAVRDILGTPHPPAPPRMTARPRPRAPNTAHDIDKTLNGVCAVGCVTDMCSARRGPTLDTTTKHIIYMDGHATHATGAARRLSASGHADKLCTTASQSLTRSTPHATCTLVSRLWTL